MKSITVESNVKPSDAEVKDTQIETKTISARVRQGRQQTTQTQAAETTCNSSARNDNGIASTRPTRKRDAHQQTTTRKKSVPRQPVLGQLDRSIQKCRLPYQPRRRHPPARGSTETSTPKRPACVTLSPRAAYHVVAPIFLYLARN
ncbi:unnamed protein product [Trichogramma brassicae]|uniref:Uncharacterized protein n=1 Tax=Trichogramma brassicae TaxID=86971 RepID=A0A6H5IFV7_9HYME|nr:unnamed protein product [Trichogramma brassicae]